MLLLPVYLPSSLTNCSGLLEIGKDLVDFDLALISRMQIADLEGRSQNIYRWVLPVQGDRIMQTWCNRARQLPVDSLPFRPTTFLGSQLTFLVIMALYNAFPPTHTHT